MEELILWLSLLAAFIKDEPIYSFILDSFPLTIVATLGAMAEQLNSGRDITRKGTIMTITNSMFVSILVSVVARQWKVPIHIQVLSALVGGAQAKTMIKIASDEFLAWVKKNVR